MSSADRWSYGQAVNFLLANVPCASPYHAARLLEQETVGGKVRAYDLNGRAIAATEWSLPDGAGEGSHAWATDALPMSDATFDRRTVEKACNLPLAKKNQGGRPLKDWEAFLIEVVSIANQPDGLPETQSALSARMLEWAEQNMDDPPKETAVRDMVSAIYRRVSR